MKVPGLQEKIELNKPCEEIAYKPVTISLSIIKNGNKEKAKCKTQDF